MVQEVTAHEMRLLSIAGEELSSRIDEIMNDCCKAAKQGNYSIYWYIPLHRNARTKLKGLGYKVEEEDNQRDGYVATISWN